MSKDVIARIIIGLIGIGIPGLILGFLNKGITRKVIAAFSTISFLGLSYFAYTDIYTIDSVSAKANFIVELKDDSMANQIWQRNYPGSESSIQFIRDKQPILIIPSSIVVEKSVDSNNSEVIGLFDLSANPHISQINKNIKEVRKSDFIQIKLPFTHSNGQKIKNGKIEITFNYKEKYEYSIPPQVIDNTLVLIPIE